jgi:hypothetical protein
MSSIENKEMQIISSVMAKLNEKNIDTNYNHRSTIPMPSSEELVPSSPTQYLFRAADKFRPILFYQF